MSDQHSIRASLAKLTDVLTDIARIADSKNLERCPYKTADLRCTYSGGCRNQLWDRLPSAGPTDDSERVIHCAGDHLNFDPVLPHPSAQNPEPNS